MDLGLAGKVAIVTGAASGIGRAVAAMLVAEGAQTVGLDRSNVELNGCEMMQLDLGDDNACRVAVDAVLRTHGQIYGLVNCAGKNDVVGLQAGPERFRMSVNNSLTHYYTLASLCRTSLIECRGAIVNIASKTGLTGQGGTSGYAAAKAGQLGLTREWAVELAPHGVRVNAVIPAEVMTPMYAEWLSNFPDSEAMMAEIKNSIPLGNRMTKPEEVAAMAVFLLSKHSAHTTGQWLHVDGGYTHLDRRMTQSSV